MKFKYRLLFPALVSLFSISVALPAQTNFVSGQLDPTRDIASPQLADKGHIPLPEQYIWTADQQLGAQAAKNAPLYFRAVFQVETVPRQATLYVAGAEAYAAYINGKLVDKVQDNPASPLKMPMFETDVSGKLHAGKNVLALEITSRGDDNQLVAKIVPATAGVDAPALLISGPSWRSSRTASQGWQSSGFNDTSWPSVDAMGGIESSIDFLQANDDAGLYRWPGYLGISPFLAHVTLPIESISHVFTGRSSYENLDALTHLSSEPDAKKFTVLLASAHVPEQQVPSLLLDFGKEVTGRIAFISDSDHAIQLTVQYGESKDETLIQPYLGVDPITVLPHATAYGPKSAFRYAKVRFVGGGPALRFQSIALDDIYYPVKYRGSFESSDPLLNKIWEVGAYTSHLCMQDDIWDAPKRDRARWAGDLDVSGRDINDIFADHFLMQETMTNLLGNAPIKSHVNDISGYSAWWIDVLTQYYLHTGSKDYLESLHGRLVQLLNYMDTDVDARNLFADQTHTWDFVDWSPDLDGNTPEARRATQFEFYLAYQDAAFLLRQLGDTANAAHFEQRAALLKAASQKYLLDPSTNTFGPRWQTNAAAVFTGVADPSQYAPIWDHVLSSVANTKYTALVMTPYYNYYIISAMAETGHRAEALEWIRKYWGGMLAEGATSFWEAYYPSWPKNNFHASLQADGGTGYFVSLAHGWSTGPTPWLMEQILGIQPTAAGFSQVTIRPDLAGLTWAKGAEPTPHGLLKVDLHASPTLETTIDLPPDEVATVLVPLVRSGQSVLVNGKSAQEVRPAENGTRVAVILRQPGHYVLQAQ
ncbi:MAG: alpha-L-rhamnosidase C-terminal domain-containing protein [Acidobacteriaceae bacterium]